MFKISADGVLDLQRDPPDFEMPRGGIADTNSNTYKVVVQASDGATMAPLSWFKVTVEVDRSGRGRVDQADADGAGTASRNPVAAPGWGRYNRPQT